MTGFDYGRLKQLFMDFNILTGIHIALFGENFEELFGYPDRLPEFCRIIRENPAGLAACRDCDRRACLSASKRAGTYIYRCHSGLYEACTAIRWGGVIVGYLIVGNLFGCREPEAGWAEIEKRCSGRELDFDRLKAAAEKLPAVTETEILAAAHIMEAVALYLCSDRVAVLRQDSLAVQADGYIRKNLSGDLSIQTICSVLGVGKTKLCSAAKSAYGMGLAEYIRSVRVERAKALLRTEPRMSINEIAGKCGFYDYNYFITVFKKITGTTPHKYRSAGGKE